MRINKVFSNVCKPKEPIERELTRRQYDDQSKCLYEQEDIDKES